MAQSTNDVFPTAIRIAILTLVEGLYKELAALEENLIKKLRNLMML